MTPAKAIVAENSATIILARVVGADGAPIVHADIVGFTVKVFDRDATDTPTYSDTPDVAEVVYDELQVDARWSIDAIGYNLAIGLPGSALPIGDHNYRAEIKVTPVTGDAYYVLADLSAIEVLSE